MARNLDLLVVPLKKPYEVDVTKPLKNLIASSYNNVGNAKMDEIMEGINSFGKLRSSSVFKVFEKYESSIPVITK